MKNIDMTNVKLEFIPVKDRPNLPRRGIRLIDMEYDITVECDKYTESVKNFHMAKKLLAKKIREV